MKTTLINRAIVKRVFWFLLLMMFVGASTVTLAADRSKIGGIYTILKNAPAYEVTDSVEIVEFMSFYCGHCYRFSKKELILKGRHPHRLRFKYIPIHWGNASAKPSEAYLIARDMGKGNEMRKLLFQASFEHRKDISRIPVLEKLATSIGLGEEFNRRLRSGEKNDQVLENLDLARKFSINETPSFIIAGNIMVSPGMSGGNIEALTLNIDTIVGSFFSNK